MKKEKGITLIALEITIIVLLILAGVSIAMVLGNNGILSQASRSVIKTKESSAKEEVALAWSSVDSEYWGAWSSNTSKQRTEYFTEANLNKYLEGTGTVTNLVYNPGGVSTLTYTSKADNLAYELQIDSSGKVSGVGEAVVPPTPEDPTPITGQLSSIITSANYGDKVNYTANGVSDWRIFYNDGSNVFIIATDYLPASKVPSTLDMDTTNEYRTGWGTNWPVTSVESNVATKYKYSGVNTVTASNDNYKATAALLDTSAWSSFVDSNLGENAIGSPTVEMWIASWNEKYSDMLECQATTIGYQVRNISTDTWAAIIESSVMSEKAGYQIEETNNMYYPHKNTISDNGGTCYGYWLASPSAYDTNIVMRVRYSGYVGYGEYNIAGYSVRPVVCLQSSVNGTKSGETWTLSK